MDIARIRSETPGCSEVIYLNNAGASLPPAVVVDTVVGYLREEARVGGYELAERREEEIAGVYRSVAGVIGEVAEPAARAA